MVRRVEQIDNLLITTEENIMIIDNGCEQTIINSNSFLVQSFAGVIFNVGGALQGMSSSNLELVNEAYTLANLCDSTKVLFKINHFFLIETRCKLRHCCNHTKCVLMALLWMTVLNVIFLSSNAT